MKTKKWTKKEMRKHGWEISYYGGWCVDLKAPKGLSEREHDSYLDQKAQYINSLAQKAKTNG